MNGKRKGKKSRVSAFFGFIVMIVVMLNLNGVQAQPYPNTGNQSVCLNANEPYGVIPTPGSTYAWAILPLTGGNGAITGSGSSISVLWTNVGTCTLQVIETNVNGCVGPPVSIVVTVNPIPDVVATPAAQALCSGASTSIALSGSVPGTTFAWTYTVLPAGSVTGALAGSGNSISQPLVNTTPNPATVTYTITPTANACPGPSITVVVTVNPTPVAVATPSAQAICSGASSSIALSSLTSGTTFSWTASVSPAGSVTGAISGSGNTISQPLVNNTSSPATVTYTITPTANGCPGLPITAVVTVNPLPVPVIAGPTPVCVNSINNIYTTQPGMTNYSWSITGGSITAGINTNTITVTWNTVGTQSVSVTYRDTNGCDPAAPTVYPVVVNPLPSTSPIFHN
jgi:hypothetical protein